MRVEHDEIETPRDETEIEKVASRRHENCVVTGPLRDSSKRLDENFEVGSKLGLDTDLESVVAASVDEQEIPTSTLRVHFETLGTCARSKLVAELALRWPCLTRC